MSFEVGSELKVSSGTVGASSVGFIHDVESGIVFVVLKPTLRLIFGNDRKFNEYIRDGFQTGSCTALYNAYRENELQLKLDHIINPDTRFAVLMEVVEFLETISTSSRAKEYLSLAKSKLNPKTPNIIKLRFKKRKAAVISQDDAEQLRGDDVVARQYQRKLFRKTYAFKSIQSQESTPEKFNALLKVALKKRREEIANSIQTKGYYLL